MTSPPLRSRPPVLMAVDHDPAALAMVEQELGRRFGGDYRVVGERTAEAALDVLSSCKHDDEDVALVLADQWLGTMTGADLLARVSELHPTAKRAMLVPWGAWGDRPTADAMLQAMALGLIDYYVLKPWRSPDEYFHRTVAEFVHEWSRTHPRTPKEVVVVGERWSARTHEVVSLLGRNAMPHTFYPADSPEGRRVLAETGQRASALPIVQVLGGKVLIDPSPARIAEEFGITTQLDGDRDYDLVVVGAGPAGLASAVYGSSEGLRTLVVEREAIGGQAGTSSLIRNYLGFSRGVSGSELATRAYQQAWVFGTQFLLMQEAVGLRAEGDRRVVTVTDGTNREEVTAGAVVLGCGVAYRRLGIPALEDLSGAGVFYGAAVSEARALEGQQVYIVGGGNSAGQAAMHVCRFAERVTILVRGGTLARSMSSYLRGEIEASGGIDVRYHTQIEGGGGEGRLEHLTLRDTSTGEVETVPAGALFVLIGARPRVDWLPHEVERDEWGFVMTGPAVTAGGDRTPLPNETSMPGVFAIGDVRHRSVKRVASAVGEGSVAISQVHEYLGQLKEDTTTTAGSARPAGA